LKTFVNLFFFMARVYITRHIPEKGISMLRDAGHEVEVSTKDGVLTATELKEVLSKKPYDAVLCLLTDLITKEVFDAVPTAKIFANYAVGYNNIQMEDAKTAGVTITNTPGVLTDTVAEYTVALMLAVAKRIPEADAFTRRGEYEGWAPELFLGSDLKGKTLGILGAGRIGYEVAMRMHHGFGMRVVYNDVAQNTQLEESTQALYMPSCEEVLTQADVVSVHVPLLPETAHLINAERIALMKQGAILINTSRGPVVDEEALVQALKNGSIRAGLDVFEHEPALTSGLAQLPNVVLTPHIASASEETRSKMSEIAAQNIIDFLAGKAPQNIVTV
jgi:lactate dehydrogenase-like 2-hydroxyacid dehydrogenase